MNPDGRVKDEQTKIDGAGYFSERVGSAGRPTCLLPLHSLVGAIGG